MTLYFRLLMLLPHLVNRATLVPVDLADLKHRGHYHYLQLSYQDLFLYHQYLRQLHPLHLQLLHPLKYQAVRLHQLVVILRMKMIHALSATMK